MHDVTETIMAVRAAVVAMDMRALGRIGWFQSPTGVLLMQIRNARSRAMLKRLMVDAPISPHHHQEAGMIRNGRWRCVLSRRRVLLRREDETDGCSEQGSKFTSISDSDDLFIAAPWRRSAGQMMEFDQES